MDQDAAYELVGEKVLVAVFESSLDSVLDPRVTVMLPVSENESDAVVVRVLDLAEVSVPRDSVLSPDLEMVTLARVRETVTEVVDDKDVSKDGELV